MKNILKRSLSFLLAITLIFGSAYVGLGEVDFSGLFAIKVSAANSGTCGENLTWVLDDEGTLTISGTGKMTNYLSATKIPWTNLWSKIKNVIVNNGITNIGDYAFSDCTSLTSITIPDSVTSIGYWGFYNCTSLESVTLGDSVTSIGDYAFYNCESLTSVTIGDSVTSIGIGAFFGCESLTSINVPDGVTSIGEHAFNYCTSLTSVTIGDSVTSIGKVAFSDCISLTSITIPDSVTYIGDCAFYNTGYYNDSSNWEDDVLYIGNHLIDASDSLNGEYTIKIGTKTIAEYAFYECRSLTSIIIPDSVTSIGSSAFGVCSLTSVYIKDITSWCNINFADSGSNPMSYATFLYIDGELPTDIVIPYGVKIIPDSTFKNSTSLTSITIPDSVKSIGDYAFSRCSSLTSITIPDSVIHIGDSAFSGCTKPISITIPNSVTSIGNYAFYYCTSLTSVTIGDSVTSIGVSAFGECYKLNKVTTPCNSYASTFFNKSILNLSHTPTGEWIIDRNPTCAIEGSKYRQCSRCNGKAETGIIEPLSPDTGCTFGLWQVDEEPTCSSVGKQSRECSVCGYVETTEIPKFSHTVSDWIITSAATCTENGKKIKKCTVCDTQISSSTIYATGHSYGDWYDEVPSTCSTKGHHTHKCSICNYTEEVELALKSHNYSEVEVVTPSTCSVQGTGKHFCLDCGITEYISLPLAGHTLSDWIIDNEAGTKHKDCTVCGEMLETEALPKVIPDTPTLTSATRVSNGVKVSWGAVEGADEYIVYRKTAKTGWTRLGVVTTNSFTDTKAKTGTTYYYTVRAQNEAGASGYNKTGLKIKYVAAPKLTKITNESSGVRVYWSKVSGADGYYLYRRVAGSKTWTKVATIKKGSTTSYLDKKASAGKTYEYIIKCYDGSTPSASAAKVIKIKRLTVPKLVSAKSGKSGITFKWGKVAGAEGYLVYRKTGKGSWVQLTKVEGNAKVSFADKSAKKGKTYTYTVRAYSGSYKSAYNTKGLTVKDKY